MFRVKTLAAKPSVPRNKAIVGGVRYQKWQNNNPEKTMPRFYTKRQP